MIAWAHTLRTMFAVKFAQRVDLNDLAPPSDAARATSPRSSRPRPRRRAPAPPPRVLLRSRSRRELGRRAARPPSTAALASALINGHPTQCVAVFRRAFAQILL